MQGRLDVPSPRVWRPLKTFENFAILGPMWMSTRFWIFGPTSQSGAIFDVPATAWVLIHLSGPVRPPLVQIQYSPKINPARRDSLWVNPARRGSFLLGDITYSARATLPCDFRWRREHILSIYVIIVSGYCMSWIAKGCKGKLSSVVTYNCTERLASAIFWGANFNCTFRKNNWNLCT